MVKLKWSPKAAFDLVEICDFIAKDSDHYARIFVQRIVTEIEKIPDFPQMGRIVPEYKQEDIREKIFQNYRIIYRISKDMVEIVAIVHCARMLV